MRVIDAAVSAAWAMEERALATLLEIASREHQITPEALAAYQAKSLESAERALFRDGVAILNVVGPLFKRANLMTAYCGATSYESLMRDFATSLDDGKVKAILLNVDSPGGEVSGCAEFAQAIFDARGRKPIVAYAGDMACSAAYWIASACDTIVIGLSAEVGSIGVRGSIPDTRARDAKTGVVRHEFVSSQSPYKNSDPATNDGRARIQTRVNALAQVFVETVARNRDVTVAQVLDGFGKGDVLIGQAAVDADMADDLGTFESTVAELARANPFSGLAQAGAGPEVPFKSEQAQAMLIERNEGEIAVALILGAMAPVPAQAAEIASAPERAAAAMALKVLGSEPLVTADWRASPKTEGDVAAAMILDAMKLCEPEASIDGEAAAAMILETIHANSVGAP